MQVFHNRSVLVLVGGTTVPPPRLKTQLASRLFGPRWAHRQLEIYPRPIARYIHGPLFPNISIGYYPSAPVATFIQRILSMSILPVSTTSLGHIARHIYYILLIGPIARYIHWILSRPTSNFFNNLPDLK